MNVIRRPGGKTFLMFLFMVVAAGMLSAPVAVSEEAPAAEKTDETPVMHFKGMLPAEIPIPGDPRPYSASPYAAQIDKALAYMAFKDRDPNRMYWLVLLDYLQRRYMLHERYALKSTLAPHLKEEGLTGLGNFQRLVDPEFVVPEDVLQSAEPLEQLALRALYCDVYPIDDALFKEIAAKANEGMSPYVPTLGMAFLWLRENGCLNQNREEMLARDALAVCMRNHLREKGVYGYMTGQCLALLYALGHRQMVDEAWIEEIAGAQNADGGWPGILRQGVKGMSDGAATIHMLWALFEHALPEVRPMPLYVRTVPEPHE